jgi:putative sigma-54 modulation protein
VKVVVHDRTEELPATLREYTERRLNKLSRHFDRVLEATVDFSQPSGRGPATQRVVQIVVRMDGRKHALLRARESAPGAQAALDLALDKVDRQVTKLKEKIKVERKRGVALAEAGPAGEDDPEHSGPEAPIRLRVKLRPESLDGARRALEANGHVFHLFLDEDTGAIQVAFRRKDGSMAVIDPVVP